jgi:hypothetical protein
VEQVPALVYLAGEGRIPVPLVVAHGGVVRLLLRKAGTDRWVRTGEVVVVPPVTDPRGPAASGAQGYGGRAT